VIATLKREAIVYGVGALKGAARGDRMIWALHRAALMNGIVPVAPALVVAEGFRTEARGDRLEMLLAGARIEELDYVQAREVGELASRIDASDLVSMDVVRTAERRNAAVVSERQPALKTASDLLGHDLVMYAV
jgi:hypothetical protein